MNQYNELIKAVLLAKAKKDMENGLVDVYTERLTPKMIRFIQTDKWVKKCLCKLHTKIRAN